MAKFFVDAFADMFGKELEENGLILAPSKIKHESKIIDFKGWPKAPTDKQKADLSAGKYQIVHITQEEWIDFFTPFLQAGEDIAFFTISQKLFTDGACDLRSAFCVLEDNFPKRKIKLVDTLTVSRGVSEIASLASLIYKKENNFESAVKFAENLAGKYLSTFVADDTKFLTTNPILSGLKLAGGLVGVKPIISIDNKGNFKILDKSRGFKAGVKKLLSIVKANGENIADYTFSIVYSNAKEEAISLKTEFLKFIDETDIRITPASLNNMTIVGAKFVAVTFHAGNKTL